MQYSGGPTVRIYNPLHNVLANFVNSLTETFRAGGVSTVQLSSVDGEVGGAGGAKVAALASHVWKVRRHVQSGGPNVVAWPLLGWWDAPLWRHGGNKTFIVMHDPEPLALQDGLTAQAASRASRLSGRNGPHMITMSPEAHAIVGRYFSPDRVHLLPLPMKHPRAVPLGSESRSVLVLGQYKPARDLDVMKAIGPVLRAAGWIPTVAGRGWPALPGWHVVDRFLSDLEFKDMLSAAACVLVPYRHYFQSEVSVRALEVGVPVVGRQTGFMTSVLGVGFPGAVEDWDDPQSWLQALQAATSGRSAQMSAAAAYSRRGASEWCSLILD